MLLAHLLTTLAKLLGSGGAKAIVADSLLMKQQLLVINRSRRRAPNLTIETIVELKRRNPRFGYPGYLSSDTPLFRYHRW